MNNKIFNISRIWNKFAYKVVDLGRFMIWDYTGRNKDILQESEFISKSTREIMTETYKFKRALSND